MAIFLESVVEILLSVLQILIVRNSNVGCPFWPFSLKPAHKSYRRRAHPRRFVSKYLPPGVEIGC